MDDRSPNVVVVVGASARVVEALMSIAAGLPPDLQDPREAEFPDMPYGAIAHDDPDRVLPARAIPAAIAKLVEGLTKESALSDNAPEEMSLETSYAAPQRSAVDRAGAPGEPSAFSCPACGDRVAGEAIDRAEFNRNVLLQRDGA